MFSVCSNKGEYRPIRGLNKCLRTLSYLHKMEWFTENDLRGIIT